MPDKVCLVSWATHLPQQVAGGPGRHDIHVAVWTRVRAVLPVGQHPAVGLAIHGLRAQRGRHQVHAALAL
jgi:hypothetical protein